ncbi:hypothetical protein FQN54_008718 [Arachnomyces sp. PD_36]|nr:hypothetical protein FQN54_008718 [Arachnomyces sp. PD_36]
MGLPKWLSRFKKNKGDAGSSTETINDHPNSSLTPGKLSTTPSKVDGQPQEKEEPDKPEAPAPPTESIPDAEEIWSEAYSEVKSNKALQDIVNDYEATVRSEIEALASGRNDGWTGAAGMSLTGELAKLDDGSRQKLMTRLVNKGSDRPPGSNGRQAISDLSKVVESTKKTIGTALQVYPPASIAWAGVCLVLTPVLDKLCGIKKESEKNRESLTLIWKNYLDFSREKERSDKQRELIAKFKPDPSQHNYQAYQDYLDHIDTPLEGTNTGVRNHSKYKRWEFCESRLLLVAANPGTGKSVLAKSLLHELSNSGSRTVCSFFFKDGSGQQNRSNAALCKILHELFLARRELIDVVADKIAPLDADYMRSNFDFLWETFLQATRHAPSDSIIVLLDALDEINPEQGKRLFAKLRQFSGQSVRFFLTARPIQPVLDALDPLTESILNLDDDPECNQSLRDDIAKVAESRLEAFFENKKIKEEHVKAELRGQLEQNAQKSRTYLFVALLFDYLDQQPKRRVPSKWMEVFQKMPNTLYETYSALLKGIDEDNWSDVKTMLQIVLVAQRPLTVREMNIALNVGMAGLTCNVEQDLQLMSVEDFKSWIHETCRFFLVTYDSRVYFIHQSVRDYLLPDSHEDRRPTWLADDFSIRTCHEAIMKSCLEYISAPFIKKPEVKSVEEFFYAPLFSQVEYHQWCMDTFEFGEYAFTRWFIHLDYLRKSGNEGWSELLEVVRSGYGQQSLDLAEAILCTSSFPYKNEVEVFKTMPLMGDSDRGLALSCLSQGLITRFLNTGLFPELCYAIDLANEVIDQADDNDHSLGRKLVNVSRAYVMHFSRSFEIDSSQSALNCAERAVLVTTPGHVDRTRALAARGTALAISGFGKRELDKVIEDMNSTFDLASYSLSSEDRAEFLHSLVVFHGYRYRSGGGYDSDDLDKAIEIAEMAVDGILVSNPRRSNAIHSLSVWLGERAELTEKKEHLDQAIEADRKALECALPVAAERFMVLRELASHLRLRYERYGSKDDINEALDAARQAVDGVSEGSYWHGQCLDLYEGMQMLAKGSQDSSDGDSESGSEGESGSESESESE